MSQLFIFKVLLLIKSLRTIFKPIQIQYSTTSCSKMLQSILILYQSLTSNKVTYFFTVIMKKNMSDILLAIIHDSRTIGAVESLPFFLLMTRRRFWRFSLHICKLGSNLEASIDRWQVLLRVHRLEMLSPL